ncbi:AsmA family protein, partial [Vibrio diabolicus]
MKKLLLILAIPIVVILVAILALTIFVNPNQFKPLIVEQAQKQTGLELVIEG